jgi:hypothetical protein
VVIGVRPDGSSRSIWRVIDGERRPPPRWRINPRKCHTAREVMRAGKRWECGRDGRGLKTGAERTRFASERAGVIVDTRSMEGTGGCQSREQENNWHRSPRFHEVSPGRNDRRAAGEPNC